MDLRKIMDLKFRTSTVVTKLHITRRATRFHSFASFFMSLLKDLKRKEKRVGMICGLWKL